jgi:putative transposase
MEFPFAGSRMLQGLLVQEGLKVGRLHVATLMKRMGIEALYRRPNTSKLAPGHKIYPYLLRKLPITRERPAARPCLEGAAVPQEGHDHPVP